MKTALKKILKSNKLVYKLSLKLYTFVCHLRFKTTNSKSYWENRYATGGNSGAGSYNELAMYKAEFLNNFMAANSIKSVVEWGCGDGNQLKIAKYENYTGVDVSKTVIEQCRKIFVGDSSKKFYLVDEAVSLKLRAEASLSLDVIYHLIEDAVFNEYMKSLFEAAIRYVIIYSSNFDERQTAHVKPRKFTDWIEKNKPEWSMLLHEKNRYPYVGDNNTGSLADFYIFSPNN